MFTCGQGTEFRAAEAKITALKMEFSVKDFFSKCDQILNGKLHFLYSETSIGSLTNSFYDPALANISAFRLPPELILSLKYGQKTLE